MALWKSLSLPCLCKTVKDELLPCRWGWALINSLCSTGLYLFFGPEAVPKA